MIGAGNAFCMTRPESSGISESLRKAGNNEIIYRLEILPAAFTFYRPDPRVILTGFPANVAG